jgi:hypothetical protein
MGADLDLESRVLCPDGACIGVIGDDGRCRVCGRAGEAPPVRAGRVDDDADGDQEDAGEFDDDFDDDDGDRVEAGAEGDPALGGSSDFDDGGELCPDGACIGLLGPDGACKVCGRRRGS